MIIDVEQGIYEKPERQSTMLKIFNVSATKFCNMRTWLALLFCLLGSVGQALPAQFAYVANNGSNTVSVYSIDPATGALAAAMKGGDQNCPYKN